MDIDNNLAKKILKKAKNGVISSKNFKEILENKTTPKNSNKPNIELSDFYCKVEQLSNGFKFILLGRHHSKNVLASTMSLKSRIKYKNLIKLAFNSLLITENNKTELFKKYIKEQKITYDKALIYYTFYNPYSRDCDANMDSIKIITDCIVKMGLLVDDKRRNLKAVFEREIISDEYKVEIIIQPFNGQELIYNVLGAS